MSLLFSIAGLPIFRHSLGTELRYSFCVGQTLIICGNIDLLTIEIFTLILNACNIVFSCWNITFLYFLVLVVIVFPLLIYAIEPVAFLWCCLPIQSLLLFTIIGEGLCDFFPRNMVQGNPHNFSHLQTTNLRVIVEK